MNVDNTSVRTNAGYTIIETVRIDEHLEIVLGRMETSLGTMYVTWQCSDGDNYFWGHYFDKDASAARRDLFARALEQLPK